MRKTQQDGRWLPWLAFAGQQPEHYTKEQMERIVDFVEQGQKLMNFLNVHFLSVSADDVPIGEETITKFDARQLAA